MTQMLTTINPIAEVLWSEYTLPVRAAGSIHVVILSDVHLGHDRIRAKKMIGDLDLMLSDERMAAIDVIVITGDLFDQRLAHDSDDAYLICRWMERLIRRAVKHNVMIRVLEGTPSHDNRQSRWMVTYNDLTGNKADLRYYPELTIDELFPGGPTVLYVPDEVNHDANKTWEQVCELLRTRGIDKVDFAFMHGFFKFQAPVETVSSHLEERYLGITRHLIVNGHDHTRKVFDRIRIPGSPDRHKHRQEENKGHIQFSYSLEKGVFDEKFIINENAVIFTTLDVEGKSQGEVEALLNSLQHTPDGSNYRLRLSRADETFANFTKVKAMYPHFKLTTDTVESKKFKKEASELVDRPVTTSIRQDTIKGLMMPRFKNLRPEVIAFIEAELDKGVENVR